MPNSCISRSSAAGSPTNRSITRAVPNPVLRETRWPSVTWPMMRLWVPVGWDCMAARTSSACPGGTTTTSLPSLARYSGSSPQQFAQPPAQLHPREFRPRLAGSRPGRYRQNSFSTVARPPRVASRMARTWGQTATMASTRPLRGWQSLCRSVSRANSSRATIIVAPWLPIGPLTSTTSPGCRWAAAGVIPPPHDADASGVDE